jgi:hypothetical protein
LIVVILRSTLLILVVKVPKEGMEMKSTQEKKELPAETNYLVVLQNKSGRTPGLRTWTNFGTKSKLEEAQKNEKWLNQYEVVAEGVDPETAVRICQQVPPVILLAASLVSQTEQIARDFAIYSDSICVQCH